MATLYGILILDITNDAEWQISDTVIDFQWLSSKCCKSNVLLKDCVFLLTFILC
jgi:hypothetical protein